ncbi:unnamed protein product [Triticum turgidum subsp. durum]|uniref:F-box domain-containing protein n=1 Tax=Triticum turgidum subsp. durum TaxID=4567 RepID=A0A9R1QP52_TRITD|nr:unnamed protein product [Triticum turgidum subsp. durum]
MSASDLPDELWARVLELGAASAALGFRDLCCLAIASRRLRRLSLHPALWFERHKLRLTELEESMCAEGDRIKATAQELDSLERVRRASVALNVWQPQVVHGRQKQLVQQCTVPVDSRLSALHMELKV